MNLMKLFVPFSGENLPLKTLATGQAIALIVIWFLIPTQVLPSPIEIFQAWVHLADDQKLLVELMHSAITIWKAIVATVVLTFAVSVLSTADFFKPLARWITAFRFLGFAGVTFIFTLLTNDGAELKLWLLTFGMSFFLLANNLAVIDSVTQEEIDYGKTLHLRGWQITWEMIVRAKMADALDLIRQSAAMGWMLLSMVEGLVRYEGGIGALLLGQNRFFRLDGVFAIQVTILLFGIGQDYMLRYLRGLACPYAKLSEVRS
jgi:NitT/TauT family transport system permease protein